MSITKGTTVSAPTPVQRRGKISKKEGRMLAKTNGSLKTWVISKNTRLHLSSIQEEEDGNISRMEVDKMIYMARGKRIAEANAKRKIVGSQG